MVKQLFFSVSYLFYCTYFDFKYFLKTFEVTYNNNLEGVNLLISNGANICLRDINNKTAFYYGL